MGTHSHPTQTTTQLKPTNPTHQTINMSAPNANAPNEGIIGQVTNSVSNAANYVSETIQGATATSSKEANKEQAKGNVPGKDSLTDRASAALDAGSDKIDEKKHEGSAKANKQGI